MPALLRSLVVVAVFVAGIPRAHAETDVVVLGPATQGTVPPARVKAVKAIMDRMGVGTPDSRSLDAACAADPSCLTRAGTELNAHRVLALTISEPARGKLAVTVALVDVIGKEMIAVRDFTIGDKRLGKDLTDAVKKFLDEAPTDRAKALFAEGNQHFNLGEMEPALELYKRAYRIKPLPAFQFNIAQCQRKLGHYQEAINLYQAYLVNAPDAATKQTVESLIAESKTAMVEQQKRDQEKAALAAKVESERLVTEKKKADDAVKAKQAEAIAAAEQRKTEQARIAHEEHTYNRHPARKWMFVTALLGAGAAGTGAYFGVKAKNLQTQFNEPCNDSSLQLDGPTTATCNDERAKGNRYAALSNALIAGGAGVVLLSAIVFAIDPGNVEHPDAPRAQLRVAPTSVALEVSW